jgi:hypothetical protein
MGSAGYPELYCPCFHGVGSVWCEALLRPRAPLPPHVVLEVYSPVYAELQLWLSSRRYSNMQAEIKVVQS